MRRKQQAEMWTLSRDRINQVRARLRRESFHHPTLVKRKETEIRNMSKVQGKKLMREQTKSEVEGDKRAINYKG